MSAKRRVGRLQELLTQIGLEAERVQMVNMSSAMAGQFVDAATQMRQTIADLGPNPLKSADVSGKHLVHTDEKVEVEQ